MRLKSWASKVGPVAAAVCALALVSGVHVRTQSPFIVFGSNSGTPQTIKATSNALWVSIQGLGASSTLCWTARACLSSPADGIVQATNNAGTSFTRLVLGANDATTNGASWVMNGGSLEAKKGDGSAYTTVSGLNFNLASGGSFQGLGGPAITATAPTIASGGCTSPAVTDNNGTASFKITLGSSCTGVKTFTLTMPAAAHRWSCNAHDLTTPDSFKPDMTAASSTTAVVITNYSRTTGAQIDYVAAEVLQLDCHGG